MKELYQHQYLIGFDSDGCVFNNMTIKHQKCFGPAFVETYGLSAIATEASIVWDFVNLFGRTRGCNRFQGVVNSIHWLQEWSKIDAPLPSIEVLENWVNTTASLSNNALIDYKTNNPSAELDLALEWSYNVNQRVGKLDVEIPPIDGVKAAILEASKFADMAVISQAPSATVEHEWNKYELDNFMCKVCGQEYGSKAEQFSSIAQENYAINHKLLVGDAVGDYHASQKCGALFYPIVAGREEESWAKFLSESLPRFVANQYAGEYQDSLLKDFKLALPEHPEFI